jgi:hydroxyacylglutathione hydrolase
MDVRRFVVGMVEENCYLVRREGSKSALVVDPGADAATILEAIEQDGVELEAILVTHCHYDHIGAVAPLARATGAPVWAPAREERLLADIKSYIAWPGVGPLEGWDAEHLLEGGETIELAGFGIDVLATPGHSPGHLVFSLPAERAVFSGDILFKGSIGRTGAPGANETQLIESIRGLIGSLPPETTVYPGHREVTSIGAELATNPFLRELASESSAPASEPETAGSFPPVAEKSPEIDAVRHVYEVWNGGDIAAFADALHADITWRTFDINGLERELTGRAEVRRFLEKLGWMSLEPKMVAQVGEHVVARLEGGSPEMPMTALWTVRDGTPVAFRLFFDEATALASAKR